MRVILEKGRATCDHCGELTQAITLYAEFANELKDSIQLCDEHAIYFAKEILKEVSE